MSFKWKRGELTLKIVIRILLIFILFQCDHEKWKQVYFFLLGNNKTKQYFFSDGLPWAGKLLILEDFLTHSRNSLNYNKVLKTLQIKSIYTWSHCIVERIVRCDEVASVRKEGFSGRARGTVRRGRRRPPDWAAEPREPRPTRLIHNNVLFSKLCSQKRAGRMEAAQ